MNDNNNNPITPRPRLYALDGLRGICAIAIMFYHFYSWNDINLFQIGSFGVYLFYILSGFSMWYVYAHRRLSIELLQAFFVARFARIFPLYALANLLSVGARVYFSGLASILSMTFLNRFLLNFTFLFGLEAPGRTSDIPGGWSIGVEWVFYLIFPLFLLYVRRLSTLLWLLTAAFILNQVSALSLFVDQTMAEQWINYTHFPTFLVYFIAGMAAAEYYNKLGRSDKKLPRLFYHPLFGRLVPLAVLVLIFVWPSPSQEQYLMGGHIGFFILLGMFALLCGSLISGFSRFEIRLYEFLGDISYSTYLMHFFVYHTVQIALKHFYPGYGLALIVALSSCLTIPAAYLLYRFYEHPARRFINRKCGHSSRH